MPTDEDAAPLAKEHAAGGTALLIIDMLSDWRFAHGDHLLTHAVPIAPLIQSLASRCRSSGVPVVYVNDNQGRWRSDFRQVVQHATQQAGEGGNIAHLLAPQAQDYFVLKPKHSGFYATPLELLLRHLRVGQLILAGVSTEHCVAMTAADACMRDFKIWCPHDVVASQTTESRDRALAHLHDAMGVQTQASTTLRLPDLK